MHRRNCLRPILTTRNNWIWIEVVSKGKKKIIIIRIYWFLLGSGRVPTSGPLSEMRWWENGEEMKSSCRAKMRWGITAEWWLRREGIKVDLDWRQIGTILREVHQELSYLKWCCPHIPRARSVGRMGQLKRFFPPCGRRRSVAVKECEVVGPAYGVTVRL